MSYSYDARNHYCTIDGTYSVIQYPEGVYLNDIRSFSDILSNGRLPFRIWGLKRSISDNHVKIDGVDLHNNSSSIELEVFPDAVRVILEKNKDNCGNVATRLFSHIQSYFASNAELLGLKHTDLIGPYTPN
jgi:hypothetical protein